VGQTLDKKSSTSLLTATGVAADDVVITINGFCDAGLLVEGRTASTHPDRPPSNPGGLPATGQNPSDTPAEVHQNTDCKTEVTRAQFEKLIDSLSPQMDGSSRIRIAVLYPEILLFASKARALGLDQSPKFQEKVKYNYLQLLWKTYEEYLAQQYSAISDSDVDEYYKEHPETFLELNLRRIFVPKKRKHSQFPASPAEIEPMRSADEAVMKAEAGEVRRKALAGANFEKLEADAYKFAAYEADEAPDVNLGPTNRVEMPMEYAQVVFKLKVGQISELIPALEGWHIVKVLSERSIPLSEAKDLLAQIRLKDSHELLRRTLKSKFNDAYFNTPRGMDPAQPSTFVGK